MNAFEHYEASSERYYLEDDETEPQPPNPAELIEIGYEMGCDASGADFGEAVRIYTERNPEINPADLVPFETMFKHEFERIPHQPESTDPVKPDDPVEWAYEHAAHASADCECSICRNGLDAWLFQFHPNEY